MFFLYHNTKKRKSKVIPLKMLPQIIAYPWKNHSEMHPRAPKADIHFASIHIPSKAIFVLRRELSQGRAFSNKTPKSPLFIQKRGLFPIVCIICIHRRSRIRV
jgi:hypothetical protein